MKLKELRENLAARLVSKAVKHTTPNQNTAKKGSIETKAEIKPKGVFEKLDHPEFHSDEQRARLDRLDDLHKQTHQKMTDAQKMGNVDDIKKHKDMLNKIKSDVMRKKEMYRQEKQSILSKNMDV